MTSPVEFGKGLIRIAPFNTPLKWTFSESPQDMRATDGLRAFDPALAHRIEKTWQRKHGGYEGVKKQLSGYNRFYGNFNRFSNQVKLDWQRGEEDSASIWNIGVKCGVAPIAAYRPQKSNSGVPHYKDRREIRDTIITEAASLAAHIRSTPEKKFSDYIVPPVVPFMKGMPAPVWKGSKTRAVWCYPAAITALESMFGGPLYKLLLSHRDGYNLPLMHGPGAFRRARGIVYSVDIGEALCVKDYVKGDHQIPPWLIRLAFRQIEGFIDFRLYNGRRVSHEDGEANLRLFRYLQWYFINTPIVVEDVLYRKSGGVPSGSLFTLLLWSFVNVMVNCYLARAVEGRALLRGDMGVCGDDSATKIRTPNLTMNRFNRASAKIGISFHPAPKSGLKYWPEHLQLQTLSTCFSDCNSMLRDEDDLFARVIYPPRWIPSREESVARTLMLAMSVCKTMPRLKAFADWYFKWKPVNLRKPVFTDKDVTKYFRYVVDAPELLFPPATTVFDIMKVYRDELFWTVMVTKM